MWRLGGACRKDRADVEAVPGILDFVAKVMVSLPDDLLEQVDAEAARRGTTRSGLLRAYADDALRRRRGERAARIAELMHDAEGHGGGVADLVKRHRPDA